MNSSAELYLPPDLIQPPGIDERQFWAFCAQRRLMFQRCGACGKHRHPPTPICPACQSSDLAWTEAPKTATVYSYTVVHHPQHAAMRTSVPYNVALLSFEGLDEVRLISNIVDVTAQQMAIGLRVHLHWQGPVDGVWLPRFSINGASA
jgi:uncharacterized protein